MTLQFHYFLRMKSQPHISFTTRYCIKVHLIIACRRRYSKFHYPKFYEGESNENLKYFLSRNLLNT